MIDQRHKLDVVPGGAVTVVHVKQYQTDATIVFELYSRLSGLTLPTSGVTATVRGTKADGAGYSATAAYSASISTVTVDLDEQMTAVAGRHPFELTLTDTNGRMITATYWLDVQRAALDADTVESESVIREVETVVQDYLEDHPGLFVVDDTLTQTGQAADAKVTGDELTDLKSHITATAELNDESVLCFKNEVGDILFSVDLSGLTPAQANSFEADFSGSHPLASQFTDWEGRTFQGRTYTSATHPPITNEVLNLQSVYDSGESLWVTDAIHTTDILECDKWTLECDFMFNSNGGAWGFIGAYGTGANWGSNLYSRGLPYPEFGELDILEQAKGSYSANPNYVGSALYAGHNSQGTYGTDFIQVQGTNVTITLNEWHHLEATMSNGVLTQKIDGVLYNTLDGSAVKISTNHVKDYYPFKNPVWFTFDGQCTTGSSVDTSNVFNTYLKNIKVSAKSAPATSLSIRPQMYPTGTGLTSIPVGKDKGLFFDKVFTPSNVFNKACTWESSDESIAKVCSGFVYGVAAGTATITATSVENSGISATYNITVSNDGSATAVALSLEGTSTVSTVVGGTTTCVVQLLPTWAIGDVSWSSSNTSVATVSNGVVSGLSEGTATITATYGAESIDFTCNVIDPTILDVDTMPNNKIQTLMQSGIEYDREKTYSFQYTFGDISSTSSVGMNSNTGVVKNGSLRTGCIGFTNSNSAWGVCLAGTASYTFTPQINDVVTVVVNFATKKANIYLNATALQSDKSIDYAYSSDTTSVQLGYHATNMNNIGITHVKITMSDLTPN